jgi:cation:H+ antiporter
MVITFALAVIYVPTGNGELLKGTVTDSLALVPIVLYGLYIFIQYQDTADHESSEDVSDVRPLFSWLLLLGSLLIILVGVEFLVRSAIRFGDLLGTPSFLWGMTIVAAGTSVPDAIMSIRIAVKHNSETSLANVLGSNVFDLLVCVPAGVLIAGSTVVNFTVVAPMMGLLILATVFLFTFMRTGFVLSDREAWFLLGLYGLFVAWLVAECFRLVNLLPGVP